MPLDDAIKAHILMVFEHWKLRLWMISMRLQPWARLPRRPGSHCSAYWLHASCRAAGWRNRRAPGRPAVVAFLSSRAARACRPYHTATAEPAAHLLGRIRRDE